MMMNYCCKNNAKFIISIITFYYLNLFNNYVPDFKSNLIKFV